MKKRSAELQSALDRAVNGERVPDILRDMRAQGVHLESCAVYQALGRIKKRTEAINRKAEILRNARRYEARRNRVEDASAYDAESDALIA
jgi:hypothetical protein